MHVKMILIYLKERKKEFSFLSFYNFDESALRFLFYTTILTNKCTVHRMVSGCTTLVKLVVNKINENK